MALAAMVAVSLFVRSQQDAEEAEGREQTDDHQAARQEDNQVIDYHLWDRREARRRKGQEKGGLEKRGPKKKRPKGEDLKEKGSTRREV